jgi:hypothetical protein
VGPEILHSLTLDAHPQVPVVEALGFSAAVWYNPPTMSVRSRTIYVYRGYAYAWRFS